MAVPPPSRRASIYWLIRDHRGLRIPSSEHVLFSFLIADVGPAMGELRPFAIGHIEWRMASVMQPPLTHQQSQMNMRDASLPNPQSPMISDEPSILMPSSKEGIMPCSRSYHLMALPPKIRD